MSPTVRLANEEDLPAIAAIAGRGRQLRAEWEPEYFQAAADADEQLQRDLAAHLADEDTVVRVVTYGADVVGCAVTVPHGDQWYVDDIAAADEGWWSDAMVELLRAVRERPAFTDVPRKDIRQLGCFATLGLRHRSSYWRLALPADGAGGSGDAAPVDPPAALPTSPLHAFGAVDPASADVTVLGDGDGYALLSQRAATPGYGPGGTTGLVDRVTGGHRGGLVDAATAESLARGDAQLVVVCAEDDVSLEDALVDRGFARVVDVYSWPGARLS